jgi:hypothetical protein
MMAQIMTAVLEIIQLYNPVTWFRRWRARKALAKGRVITEDCAYYDVDSNSQKINGPWCTTCYETKGERVRFVRAHRPEGDTGRPWAYVQCPLCKNVVPSERIGVYLNTH